MRTRRPTREEIDELLSFLSRLYAEGFEPIVKWSGGTKNERGVIQASYPTYNPIVEEFFYVASNECWMDYDYASSNVADKLNDHAFVDRADINQVKTMLTFCVRGERFCDGFWAAAIKEKHIMRLLYRLRILREEIPNEAL